MKMRLSKIVSLFLVLVMAVPFSAVTLLAQENESSQEEAEEPRPRGRQGGNERGRQGGGAGNRQQLTPEQQKQRIMQMIQRNVADIAGKVALRDDQQESFVKLMVNYEMQNQIGRGKIQQATRARNQTERRKLAQTLQKMYRATDNKVKEILDAEQFKNYQAAMKQKRAPGGQNRRNARGGA